MKIPKYSCSTCGKPSSRKWNLDRHISNCHDGIGKCLPNWVFPDTYRPYWNRWEKMAINQDNFYHIRPDMLNHLFSSNKSNARKPDYQNLFMEAYIKELAKMAVSMFQRTPSVISFPFSPYTNYNADPTANLQIFGFRGCVCDKCLMVVTRYVAFPNAAGEGRYEEGHICHPARVAAASQLADRSGLARSLDTKIPTLIKQRLNSRTGNNYHLVASRLSSPPEETMKFRNPADLSKPPIVLTYSKERHLSLEAIESKKKCDYLTRAFTFGAIPLSDEELIDFLGHMHNATFGVVTVHNNNTHEDNLSQDELSYFVYIRLLDSVLRFSN